MNLVSEDIGALRVVTVDEARLDAAVAIQFKDSMRKLTESGPGRVVLDLSRVTFLDSSGLGAVVGALKQAGPARSVELAGLTATVAKVFHLTRMDTVFTIHPDINAAKAGLADAR